MKGFAFIAVTILLLAFSAFGQKGAAGRTAPPNPQKAVEEVFDRLIEGIRQVDVDKVMGVYDKNDRILFFNYSGSATIGWENMRSNRESLYAKIKDVTLDVTGRRVEMLSKTSAYVTCKWKQSQVYNEKLENSTGRMTLVFKLIGKEWKIVHLHTSPDAPPATRTVAPSEKDN
jgi:ketosteroid isomerase-like protein